MGANLLHVMQHAMLRQPGPTAADGAGKGCGQSEGGGRPRWFVLISSFVMIMGLLVFAQSNLTQYEEQSLRNVAHEYEALSTTEGKHGFITGSRTGARRSDAGRSKSSSTAPSESYAAVVEDVLKLGNAPPPKRKKKYRSLICTLTRNDPHLREFVVRNLLAGFAHIVIYDNNQVGKGIDYDVRPMLEPFVAAGAVTLVPWDQSSQHTHLDNEKKNGVSVECDEKFGPLADWVSIMDTDEAFYIRPQEGRSVGSLNRLLEDVEKRAENTCCLKFPWRMMYGEKRVLKPQGLLMDNYHKVCKVHDAPKLIYRPEITELYNVPHFCNCRNEGGVFYRTDDDNFKSVMPDYENHLAHYYAKSVEEFLVKLEQSIPPYFRYLPHAYDHITQCFDGFNITYDRDYETVVHDTMGRFAAATPEGQNDGGKPLGPPPEFMYGKLENWELYMFFKARVALRDEWDEEGYLRLHGDVREGMTKGQWVDGLQHFMNEGFKGQRSSCWVREGRNKFCIENS